MKTCFAPFILSYYNTRPLTGPETGIRQRMTFF